MTKPVTVGRRDDAARAGQVPLDDPVSKYLPEFRRSRRASSETDRRARRRARSPSEDLLLHTSGLNHRTSDIYRSAQVRSRSIALPEFVENIVAGAADGGSRTRGIRYSEATTVLGRLVEIWSGKPFDGSSRSGLSAARHGRHDVLGAASCSAPGWRPFTRRRTGGLRPTEIEAVPFTERPALHRRRRWTGVDGSGLRALRQMLLSAGELDGVRLLKAETVDAMVVNGVERRRLSSARRRRNGLGPRQRERGREPEALRYPANRGEYGWDGTAGTIFWVDPAARTVILLLTQNLPADPGNCGSGSRPRSRTRSYIDLQRRRW